MRIAILGGAFNPPHIGHLILAQEIIDIIGLDKVFFVPTNISPHKENNEIGPRHRLAMLKLEVAGNELFEVIDLEIKRGGVSYTIDTARELKKNYPEDEFYLVIGSDLLDRLPEWKDFEDLKKEVKIVAAHRENFPIRKKDDFIIANITQIDVSSSQIRKLIRRNRSIKYLVRDSIRDYIEQHNLYK